MRKKDLPLSTLVFDIGGTKLLSALVTSGEVIDEVTRPTGCESDPILLVEGLLKEMKKIAQKWSERFTHVAAAVTGLVQNGFWSSVNQEVLNLPQNYPLKKVLEEMAGCPVLVINDAQAAAWGEYIQGAGEGQDLVFLTISTGLGGGIVANGKLLKGSNGFAGHFGQIIDHPSRFTPLEADLAGRWFAKAAIGSGHSVEAKEVFQAAQHKEQWAEEIISSSVDRVAQLCFNIQKILDPKVIVIGGGIGLASGYLDQLIQKLSHVELIHRPVVKAARLGVYAGVLGAADLTKKN